MKKTAIIDSGVKCEHPAFSGSHIKGFSISVNDSGEVLIDKDFYDEIGHGTAVFYLIKTTQIFLTKRFVIALCII